MRIHILLLAFLAGSWCGYSQQAISGKVAAPNNIPLDGAHIHIGQLHGTSAPDGNYEVPHVPSGRQRVVISYIGYKTLDTVVDVYADVRLDAVLKPESMQLEEVVITESNVAPKTTIYGQRLKTETLEKYSNASLGDALKEVAGVYSLKTGSTIVKPVINGLHSSRVPVFSNNVRLEDQQWGTEHAPNLDINSAGRVSVIKGASALQYGGDAIGGLVLVEPVSVVQDTLFGRTILTADSNGRGGGISSSLHKGSGKAWAWNAGGTFKYLGDREAPDYVLSNTGNREANVAGDVKYLGESYDASVSYSFYNAVIGIARATHIGNVADLVRAINNGQPDVTEPFTHTIGSPKQEVQHHLANANFNKQLQGNASIALQYAFQLNNRKEYDMRRGDFANIPALDLELATHSVNADWKKQGSETDFKAGLSASMQFNNASPDTGVRPLIPTYDRYDGGAYGIVSHSFSETLSGEAGLRYDFSRISATKYYQKTRWNNLGYDGIYDHFIIADYGTQWLTNPQFTYHNISASLGIRKRLSKDLDLLSNAGLAMRNPNPSELFSDGLHHSNGTIELGSLGIKKEQSFKLSATLLKQGGSFSLEAMPYLNAIRNFIYLNPTGVEYTIRGTFPVYNYAQDNVVMAGFDLHTDWDISSHFRHSFNFAYVHADNTTRNEPLIDMPSLNINNAIRYSAGWHSLFVELRSEAVFAQSRYPNNNFYADVPVNGELVPTLVDISTPPPGYHLLHFASGMQFPLGKATASVNFSVNNIFNSAYRDYLNRQRLYTDDLGRNFQLQLKFNY
ncbi:TonB-dependent receptor [Flavobacterium sp. MFBS3-15]|uniref:TonB-dependent receptor n=1 Tax=Flavobacterium sp. MFBS3-15 TaxID=2989816 RepID=UPI00223615F2|nr:TonB-dependent receptor [Flavobacterium sp. MFBS3-15]MCW4470829.1 TonB-dependent receptor [Flavobacterium sp. MFBS3-15]